MFTGIVLEVAPVVHRSEISGGIRLGVRSLIPETQELALGSSISLNGACMTLVERKAPDLFFEISPESLAKTNLSTVQVGDSINLEPALNLGSPLGGHLVTGHVDGQAPISRFEAQGDFWLLELTLSAKTLQDVGPFLVPKGSLTVDGVSLTVNQVQDKRGAAGDVQECLVNFQLIPHTLSKTCLSARKIGDFVNLEADILAKYVNRYAEFTRK